MSEILSTIDINDYGLQSMVASGGGGNLQSKDVTITNNGTTTIVADSDYDGLSDVDVTVTGILDTSDATAKRNDIADGKTAYVNGQKITGNVSTVTGGATLENGTYTTVTPNKLYITGTIAGNNLFRDGSTVMVSVSQSSIASPLGATAEKIKKDEVICGVTGTYEGTSVPDWTQIGYSGVPQALLNDFAYSLELLNEWDITKTRMNDFMNLTRKATVVYMPLVDTSNMTSFYQGFFDANKMKAIPLLDTSNVISFAQCFYTCNSLISIPQFNMSNVTDLTQAFYSCKVLENIPILDFSKALFLSNTFYSCQKLSNESLNNILYMLAHATAYINQGTNMTLKTVGLSSSQATTCQSLSNWQDCVTAGWTTGY